MVHKEHETQFSLFTQETFFSTYLRVMHPVHDVLLHNIVPKIVFAASSVYCDLENLINRRLRTYTRFNIRTRRTPTTIIPLRCTRINIYVY